MWFSKVLGVLEEYFKELPKKLKGVLSASMMFHDCFEVSSSMFCSFSRLFELFYHIFMDVLKMFQVCFDEFARIS